MRNKLTPLLLLSLSAVPLTSNAETSEAKTTPQVSPWKASVELGFVQTNGNTKTKTLNAKATVVHEKDKWRHKGQLEGFNTAVGAKTTGERYNFLGQTDYKYTKNAYALATVNYEGDRFSGYDYQATGALGGGYRFLNKKTMTLDAEAGLGFRNANPQDGQIINEGIVRLAGNFNWKLSKTSTFTQSLSAEAGKELTSSKSVTALSAQIAGNLAMKTSFTARHVTKAPGTAKKTDTETAVTLVYSL